MYGKVFESIYKGTLMDQEGWLGVYVFSSMIVLADKDGIVPYTSAMLYRTLGLDDKKRNVSMSDFLKVISSLEGEDASSNINKCGGRRILTLSSVPEIQDNRGWLIVNYDEYRKRCSKENYNEYSRGYMAAMRNIEKTSANINKLEKLESVRISYNELEQLDELEHTDTDTDTNTNTNTSANELFLEEEKIPLANRSLRKNAPPRVKKSKNLESENFKAFWLAYPKKQDKQKSIEVWTRQDLDAKFEEIMRGLMREKKTAQWLKDQGQFIPHPKTWLNNQRWETALTQVELKSSTDLAIEAFLSEP